MAAGRNSSAIELEARSNFFFLLSILYCTYIYFINNVAFFYFFARIFILRCAYVVLFLILMLCARVSDFNIHDIKRRTRTVRKNGRKIRMKGWMNEKKSVGV